MELLKTQKQQYFGYRYMQFNVSYITFSVAKSQKLAFGGRLSL